MHKTVTLIGTSHDFQFGTQSQNPNFEDFLRATCARCKAKLLAEEMSKDALAQKNLKESTVAALAIDLGISHVYCDPTNAQQFELNIYVEKNAQLFRCDPEYSEEEIAKAIKREHESRELFWLQQLNETDIWPVVFVCGSEHVNSFAILLQSNGIDVTATFGY